MGKKCPACNEAELKELVPGITQCPNCMKIFKGGEDKKEKKEKKEEGRLKSGDFWMKNTGMNPKYEVAEQGITIHREEGKRWIAVLYCHSAYMKGMKYVRISWFKKSINKHGGMFKMQEYNEMENVIIALERIDHYFDDTFKPKEKISFKPYETRKEAEATVVFDEKTKMCPNCKKTRMKISRTRKYYECVRCGEIIVLQDGSPIYNIPNENLSLKFSSNYPVNYYIPDYGITTQYHIANWKAIIIIHAKDNPNKRWMRFYWWQRNLQEYIKSKMSFGADGGLKWKTKRGVSSPNIYDKNNIRPMINALREIRRIWAEDKGIEYKPIEYNGK